MMNVLMVAAECAPFVKLGGLADDGRLLLPGDVAVAAQHGGGPEEVQVEEGRRAEESPGAPDGDGVDASRDEADVRRPGRGEQREHGERDDGVDDPRGP